MATVDKNFKVKHGLIVEGTTATVNGEDILTTGSTITTDFVQETTANQYFTEQRAIDAVSSSINSAVTTAVDALTTDDIEEGTNNLYFNTERAVTANEGLWDTAGSALDAQTAAQNYADSLAVNYDAAGSASTVQQNLDDHINDKSTHGVTGDIVGTSDAQSLSNKTFVGQTNFQSGGGAGGTNNHIDVNNSTGKMTVESGYALDLKSAGAVNLVSTSNDIILNADGAAYVTSATPGNEIATQGYVDLAITNKTEIDDNVTSTTATWSSNKINSEIDTAVGNVVGMAPEALNTLQELAQAFDNSPDTLNNLIETVGGKQDALQAGAGIEIGGTTGSVIYAKVDQQSITTNVNGEIAVNNGYGLVSSSTGLAVDTATIATQGDISGLQESKQDVLSGSDAISIFANTVSAIVDDTTIQANGGLHVNTDVIASVDYVDTNFVNVADLPGQLSDYVPLTQKGSPLGVATLDADGQVPSTQLNNIISILPVEYTTSVGENLDVTNGNLTVSSTPSFTSVEIDTVVKQVANTATVAGLATSVIDSFSYESYGYRSAEYLVKVKTGTQTEVSKILLTLDDSNNIAITEYGIVGTNGSLSTISAQINSASKTVELTLENPALAETATVNVFGTLLK